MKEYIEKILASFDETHSAVDTETVKDGREIYNAVADFFATHNFVNSHGASSKGIHFSNETLLAGHGHLESDHVEAVTSTQLEDLLSSIGFGPNHPRRRDAMKALAVELAKYSGNARVTHFSDSSMSSESMSISSLYSSGYASANILSPSLASNFAAEEFGVAQNNLALDAKLAITVSMLAFRRSIATRGFNFMTSSSDTIALRSERYELYDLNSIGVNGNKENQFFAFINLYEDPTMADTMPKLIKVLKANDEVGKEVLIADELLKTDVQISLFNMSKRSNVIGYGTADMTDSVNDNAKVESVIVEVTNGTDTEQFEISFNDSPQSMFTAGTNVTDSTDRYINGKLISGLDRASVKLNGTANTLFADFADCYVALELRVNGELNLKSSLVNVGGKVAAACKNKLGGEVPADTLTAFAALKFSVVGYKMKAYFSEENLRKSTVSMKTAYKMFHYSIPASKSVVVQFSIEQPVEQTLLKGVDELIRIGVDTRTVTGVMDVLENVERRLKAEKDYESDYTRNTKVMDEYVAGYVSRPTVRKYAHDIELATKTRESSKANADKRTAFEYKLVGIITALKTNSFFDKQYDAGETVVFTVITSPIVLAALIDLQHVFVPSDNKDSKKVPDGEYEASLVLPCGDILRFITTTFQAYRTKMLIVPCRKKDGDVLGFGTVANKGTFAGTVPFTSGNGSSNKFISNIRQWLIPTNPVGAIVEITGIDSAYF